LDFEFALHRLLRLRAEPGVENLDRLAITRASVTSFAVIPALIDQPTTRREDRSMSAAT